MGLNDIGSLGVDFAVKLQRLDDGLRQAETKVATSAARMEKAAGGLDFAKGIARAFAGINVLQGGLLLARAATQAMKGDFAAMEETGKRLPLGIGAIVRELANWRDEIMGVAAEQERLNGIVEAHLKLQKEITTVVESRAKLVADARARGLAASEELGVAKKPEGFERDRAKLTMERNRRISKLSADMDAAAEAARKVGGDAAAKIARDEVYRAQLDERRAIEGKYQLDMELARKADVQRKNDAADAERDMQYRMHEAKRAEEEFLRARQQEVFDAETRIGILRRKARGEEVAAEVFAIRRRYQVEVEEALRAGKAELADRLRIQEQLELNAALERPVDRAGAARAQARDVRYQQVERGRFGSADRRVLSAHEQAVQRVSFTPEVMQLWRRIEARLIPRAA